MNKELIEFVEHAGSEIRDPAAICQLLFVSGWRDRYFAEAVCARELEVVVSTPDYSGSARPPGTRRAESPWPRMALLASFERVNPRGPGTAQRNEYSVTGPTSHALCATRSHGRSPDAQVLWNHPTGRQCCGISSPGPTCPPHRGAHE